MKIRPAFGFRGVYSLYDFMVQRRVVLSFNSFENIFCLLLCDFKKTKMLHRTGTTSSNFEKQSYLTLETKAFKKHIYKKNLLIKNLKKIFQLHLVSADKCVIVTVRLIRLKCRRKTPVDTPRASCMTVPRSTLLKRRFRNSRLIMAFF